MFLFLDFILSNVREYSAIFDLLLTSSKSIQMFNLYYKRHMLSVLPETNTKFVGDLYDKALFWKPSIFRCQMCVVLDFFQSQRDMEVASLRIDTEYFTYENNYCLGKDWGDYDSDAGEPSETYNGNKEHFRYSYYYKNEGKPFEFCLISDEFMYVGILFSESQYIQHKKKDCYYGRLFCGNLFDRRCKENFYIVSSMGSIWILLILEDKTDESIKRCALQLHYAVKIDDTDTVSENYIRYNQIINKRLYTKKRIAKIRKMFPGNRVW